MRGALFTCILCRGSVAKFTTYFITKRILFGFLLFLTGHNFFAQCGGVAREATIISDIGSGPGVVAWTDPPNGTFCDNARTVACATVTPGQPGTTHYLYARSFNFSVPPNASVCGIEVAVERRKQSGGSSGAVVRDYSVELVSGSMVSSNYAQSLAWTDTDRVVVYGSSNNLWGKTWTPAAINHSSFGVNLTVTMQAGATPANLSAEIDHIYVIAYYSSVLPVDLQSFTAFPQGGHHVQLAWSTATERNNDKFFVERSRDAMGWQKVAEVKGAGNSLVQRTYSCTDQEPHSGLSYYRLRQQDFNGKVTTYPATTVELAEPRGLQIFNGPDAITVRMNPDELQASAIELVNAMGQRVWNAPDIGQSGVAELRIPTSSYPPGMYFVRALTLNGQECIKVYINHG
jgi:hypothetical protein